MHILVIDICSDVEFFPRHNPSIIEPRREKTCLRGFRHKPNCTATEDGLRLEVSDLVSRGIVLFFERKPRR